MQKSELQARVDALPRARLLTAAGYPKGFSGNVCFATYGSTIVVEANAFEARALQHELDHLDGLLFLDRVGSLSTDVFRRRRYK